MKYPRIKKGLFIKRPNRFIAHVLVGGIEEIVHVKNTGRCRELLTPGAEVILSVSEDPKRKTACDLVAVYKPSLGLVNMDSQAPNKVVKEWLEDQDFTFMKPEFTYGESRVDFYMERGEEKFLMEVKGCTLEVDGQGYFPDAPSERAVKHVKELIRAKQEGYEAIIAFVIQMEKVKSVLPNRETHPAFADALEEAEKQGVKVVFFTCEVKEDELKITGVSEKL